MKAWSQYQAILFINESTGKILSFRFRIVTDKFESMSVRTKHLSKKKSMTFSWDPNYETQLYQIPWEAKMLTGWLVKLVNGYVHMWVELNSNMSYFNILSNLQKKITVCHFGTLYLVYSNVFKSKRKNKRNFGYLSLALRRNKPQQSIRTQSNTQNLYPT